MDFCLNPYLFFLIEDGKVLVWDYQAHDQYLLDEKVFAELLAISRQEHSPLSTELQEANLILPRTDCWQPDWGWDALSRIFHLGTQDVYSSDDCREADDIAKAYLAECNSLEADHPPMFSEKPGELIALPAPDIEKLESTSFYSTLKNRKTSRHFTGESISLEDLSTLLFSSFGLIHGDEWEEFKNSEFKTTGMRKASPASGALHAEEVYVAAYRVEGLPAGIYHYRPQDHKLTCLSLGDFEQEIIDANYNQYFSEGLACGFYVTARLNKLWWKYKHSRSLKVALLDLGHASQTFLLSATALNLQTWITAAFQDSAVNQLIQVDGRVESAFLFLGVGHGSNQAIPENILNLLG